MVSRNKFDKECRNLLDRVGDLRKKEEMIRDVKNRTQTIRTKADDSDVSFKRVSSGIRAVTVSMQFKDRPDEICNFLYPDGYEWDTAFIKKARNHSNADHREYNYFVRVEKEL